MRALIVVIANNLSVLMEAGFRQFGQDVQTVAARLYYKDTRLSLKLLYGNEGDFKTKPAYEWQHCFEVPDIIVPPGSHCVMVSIY